MSTYVRSHQVVTVSRDFNCGNSVMVNRYTRIDLNNVFDRAVTDVTVSMKDMGECFDPEVLCDSLEYEMIAAMKNCLSCESAPQSLYERLHECIDCLCD